MLTFAVYSKVTHFDFVNWDDPRDVTENAYVLNGLTYQTLQWALTSTSSPYWQPLTWLSHALVISLFGLNPGAHHAVNLLLHLSNTALIFALFVRMTGKQSPSLFVAAVFAVHPLHVESVAWVTERNDVLSTFFTFLSMHAYVTYSRAGSRLAYTFLIGLFVFALMAKPMVVTLPILLLVLDMWPLRRMPSVAEKLPLFALSVSAALFAFVIQNKVGAVASLDVLPVTTRISNALVSYVSYLANAVWPTNLAPFYALQQHEPAWVFGSVSTLAGITTLSFYFRKRFPFLLAGWLWFLVALVPTIGLVQAGEQARADRFMYVALIGLTMAFAWLVTDLRRMRPIPAALIGGSVVAVLAVLSWHQAQIWANSETLWRHTLRVTADNYRGHEKLGDTLRDQRKIADARSHYSEALRLAPPNSPNYKAVIHNNLGLIAADEGAREQAVLHFSSAVRLNPRFAEPLGNLGNELAKGGQLADAIQRFRSALGLKPDFWEAQYNLAVALVQSGLLPEARTELERLLQKRPDLAAARDLLAKVRAAGG